MDTPAALLPATDVTPASRLLTLASIVVVMGSLYFGRRVLVPLALALVLAFLLAPVVTLLEKCRIGRLPSVVAVLALSFALLTAIGWMVSNQLIEIVNHLPDYRTNIHDKIEAIRAPGSNRLSRATATVNDLSKELSAASQSAASSKVDGGQRQTPVPVEVAAPPRNSTEYLRDAVGPLAGVLETIAIVVILTLFILVKREDLRNRLIHLAGRGQLSVMTEALDEASQRLGRYLVMQFMVNASYGLVFGLGLYLIGVPKPLLWGVLAGLLRFVPYLGAPVGAMLPMGMALAVFPGWSQVGLICLLFLVLEITVANLIEPWLYGAHTGVSSLAILVAAIFWGMLWGPVGLILSTPLTVCLILMGRYIPQLSFLEVVLGDEPVLPPQAIFYQRLLALDDHEARVTAAQYLKEKPLLELYDSVLVPALRLAEKDRHMNILDESRIRFIHQTTRELIEELFEERENSPDSSAQDLSSDHVQAASGLRIVCIPSRDDADEIVATMIMQILRRAGHHAEAVPVGSISTMIEQAQRLKPDLVCISALPPFAAAHAKALCRNFRQRARGVRIILGLWEYPGGVVKAQERVGSACADSVGTSLAQVVELVGAPAPSPAATFEAEHAPL